MVLLQTKQTLFFFLVKQKDSKKSRRERNHPQTQTGKRLISRLMEDIAEKRSKKSPSPKSIMMINNLIHRTVVKLISMLSLSNYYIKPLPSNH